MAILDDPTQPGRTLLSDGLAQSDVDMQSHRLLNLDMSNFPPSGIPPTIHPAAREWLHDWDAVAQQWTATQPGFSDMRDFLTGAQMQHIDQLGRVRIGNWQADPLAPIFVPTLDQIQHPLGNVDLAGFRLTGMAPPINPNDGVNLAFMDFMLQGLQPKESVRCATTTEITPNSLARPVDGVALVAGDRVLVKNQHAPREYQNGLYIASVGTWQRVVDANTALELERAYCTVREGTINAGTSWVQINDLTEPIGLDDIIHFILFSSAAIANVAAGNGLNKVGNTLNVVGTAGRVTVGTGVNIDPTWPGQNSLAMLGVITHGTWHADVIDSTHGGTGINNHGKTLDLGSANVVFAQIPTDAPSPSNNLLIYLPGGSTQVTLPALGRLSTTDQIETLTNKRINPRSTGLASNGTPAINIDLFDVFSITALAVNISTMSDNITGTPVDGQELILWIRDNGTSRTLDWGPLFDASTDLPLPTATTAGQWYFLRFVYNIIKAKWVMTVKLNNIP